MITDRLYKKAISSPCTFKVSAVALNSKGEVLGFSTNRARESLPKSIHHRGVHAEQVLIKRYGKSIKTIIICRVGRSGILRPIDPCDICQSMANKLGIKIVSINDVKES